MELKNDLRATTRENYNRMWHNIVEASAIGNRRISELKELASAGMDIKALQNIMGHSDASITMNVYNHSSFERTEKEVQRIDNVINF